VRLRPAHADGPSPARSVARRGDRRCDPRAGPSSSTRASPRTSRAIPARWSSSSFRLPTHVTCSRRTFTTAGA
jgi:hypothetical protein